MTNLWAQIDAGTPGDILLALGFLLGVATAFVVFGVAEMHKEKRR